MPYVTDMNSAQIRAHMKMLQAMNGWNEPLADRLYKEIIDQDKLIADLKEQLEDTGAALTEMYETFYL